MDGIEMTIVDLGSIANLLAAIGVLVTLIYLSRQVRQGNLLARSQARQHMVEQAHEELYQWKNDPQLRSCFVKEGPLAAEEQETVHYFLLAAMRQREWEWFQYKDRVIGKDIYEAYHEVIALHLGVPRTRNWWRTVGRIGFNADFVAAVDAFLDRRKLTTYFEDIRRFDHESAESPGPKARAAVPGVSSAPQPISADGGG
jgi:hypothetical protein